MKRVAYCPEHNHYPEVVCGSMPAEGLDRHYCLQDAEGRSLGRDPDGLPVSDEIADLCEDDEEPYCLEHWELCTWRDVRDDRDTRDAVTQWQRDAEREG